MPISSASLKPNTDAQKDTLANHLAALLKIRGYAIAVQQVNLVQISDPPPSWYVTLTQKLSAAQTHATTWTQTLEPAITSTIPQAVIEYGNRFRIGTKQILDTLSAANNQPDLQQRMTIVDQLSWIGRHLKDQSTNITNLDAQFLQFQKDAATDYTALTSSNDSIQQAELSDQDVVTSLQGDIAEQQASIAADDAAITASGIAGGVGLFVGVGLLGLGAAAGPAAPFLIGIGAFIMIGSIIEAATVIGVYEKKLSDAQTKLNDDQAQLTLEEQQIASLTLLNTAVSNATTENAAMAQSMSEIADWWATLVSKLDTVTSDVKDATDDTSAQDWADLSDDIQAAQSDWADFATFATNMQSIATGGNVQQVSVQPKAA